MRAKQSSIALRTAVAGVLLFFAACSCPVGRDPNEVKFPIRDGSYTQGAYSEMGQGTVTLPSALVRNKTMHVDRNAGVVHLTYTKDGKQIVETYRMAQPYLE